MDAGGFCGGEGVRERKVQDFPAAKTKDMPVRGDMMQAKVLSWPMWEGAAETVQAWPGRIEVAMMGD